MNLKDLKIGYRLKTKLSFEGKIVCSMRNINIEYFQWFTIIEIKEEYVVTINKKNEQALFDFDGNGLETYNDHIVYKIKRK